MKITTAELKSKRLWRAATGLDQVRFARLLAIFTASYLALFGKSVAARHADLQVTPSLQTEEELLLFTLFSLKSGLTYDLLGLACGMSGSNALRNQQLGLQVLQHALQRAGLLPKREFANAEEFAAYLKNEPTLIIDVTEQRTQRPSQDEAQRDLYSGKKKGCTVKALLISNVAKFILYLSLSWLGKTHDYRMFKEEFPPEENWFVNHEVRVDLGFQGIADDYTCKELHIPNKKKKKQELSTAEKAENKSLASKRIVVEHAISGLKRYRFLSDRLRTHNPDLYDDVLGICAGLWNFHLTC